MEVTLGVDIGGTNSVFGVCDRSGNVLWSDTLKTSDYPSPEALVRAISDAFRRVEGKYTLLAVGIGAPNGNYHSGTVEYAPNLHWKGSVPLAALFSASLKVPAFLTNDANAAAIGEMNFGSAKNIKNFVTITLGTGLGSGIVIDGKVIHGHQGFAGEYGHINVIPDGRMCSCGRRGCLEAYASSTGVVRSIEELHSDHKAQSSLRSLSSPTAKDVFVHAGKGDLFAQEIIDFTTEILGAALADFACFSDPKAYILFGGIAQNGPEIATSVKEAMERNILNIYKDKIEIRISSLHDKNAAILGTSSLAWNER